MTERSEKEGGVIFLVTNQEPKFTSAISSSASGGASEDPSIRLDGINAPNKRRAKCVLDQQIVRTRSSEESKARS